jgi:4-amino-4-deoxy-L-arabinose transferase-like glycosyltransferase/putative flippase GtrA
MQPLVQELPATRAGGHLVEVVVPVHNEEHVLEASIRRLHGYLTASFPFPFRITIADNASTDGTWPLARRLAERFTEVRAVHLAEKGRGRALRQVWGASDADVVAYMDVDLSTGLEALLPLVAPLVSGHSDLAIGTRLANGAAVVRGPRRELVSRCYNLLLRTAMRARFSDAQCGFKAGRTEVVQALLPDVEDQAWFFDTELLLAAQRGGLRIHEVPVDWVEDTDSRVDVVRTALDDLRGMSRVARRQLPSFALIGVVSTLAYLVLFWVLRSVTGAMAASAIALLVTAVANTAANRRFTFGVSGRRRRLRQQLEGLVVFGLGLAFTTGALALVTPASRATELAALVAANAAATLLRFVLLRSWVFHPHRIPHAKESWTMTTSTLDRPLPAAPTPAGRLTRLVRGRAGDPPWVRPSLLGLLAATALLYLWALGASGWANDFYSAAAQAASQSWKAFFYGSSDASNFITVDKPPASLWVMGLSARLFGVSSWSILVPQALMGVATVALLYATVRRWFGPAAGLVAGAVLALTPVATLIFRFNNPDALLTLLLVAGAYAVVRALEGGATRWLVLAGACVGFGFLAKQLQALLVVPAFALVYLAAAPGSLGRRLGQLVAAGAAMVAAAGWWVAIVELVPASARPYIGGSQTNSILELTFGYNGLGRLTGEETGSVGGGPGGGWGQTGWTRMFGAEVGGQVAWLLPAALILLAAGLWLTRRAPRTNRARAAFALWGGWLLVTAAVFSFMQGIFHAYYAVALAPAVGALVGMGATGLWEVRHHPLTRWWLAATMAVTAVWSWVLLRRTPDWHPELAPLVLLGGLAVAVLVAARFTAGRRVVAAVAGAGLLVALAGPAAYAIDTAATPHGGAIPSAGPAVQGAGPGGGPRGGFRGGGGPPPGFGDGGGRFGQAPPGQGQGGAAPDGGRRGGMGGLLDGATPDPALVALLRQDAGRYTWVAAAVGSNTAAGAQLASGEPVMAIGGFNGSDPAPTLEQFQRYVAEGRIHWFLGGGRMGRSMGGSDAAAEITAWVAENFAATSVGGTTVYDLTA